MAVQRSFTELNHYPATAPVSRPSGGGVRRGVAHEHRPHDIFPRFSSHVSQTPITAPDLAQNASCLCTGLCWHSRACANVDKPRFGVGSAGLGSFIKCLVVDRWEFAGSPPVDAVLPCGECYRYFRQCRYCSDCGGEKPDLYSGYRHIDVYSHRGQSEHNHQRRNSGGDGDRGWSGQRFASPGAQQRVCGRC